MERSDHGSIRAPGSLRLLAGAIAGSPGYHDFLPSNDCLHRGEMNPWAVKIVFHLQLESPTVFGKRHVSVETVNIEKESGLKRVADANDPR